MVERVVPVSLRERSYDITIGAGILGKAGKILKNILPGWRVAIVSDKNVADRYAEALAISLMKEGFQCAPTMVLPAGESQKNFSNLQAIVENSLEFKLDKKSTLIALGGGVIGDITGFAASMVMRGIHFVQVPTTLLAQVDSSVGGKTAINLPQGKNLAGAFYQPKAVLIDTDVLKTLPMRELKAGYAETLKYALINNKKFFNWLEKNRASVLSGDEAALMEAIETSCKAKAKIVGKDEREEGGDRILLNFGHTFGHALEGIGKYDGRLLHGEAVALGMMLAMEFSETLDLCPKEDVQKVKKHMESAGLPLKAPFEFKAEDMLSFMKMDKKNSQGRIRLVLTRGIGHAFVAEDVIENDLKVFLQKKFG